MSDLLKQIFVKLQSGLFRRTFVYTASASLNSFVVFLLLPVLTRYLTPYDYGVVETFLAASACLTGLVMFGGNTLLSKEYFSFNEQEREQFVGNILGLICISSVLLLLLYWSFSRISNFFANIMKIGNELILLIFIVALANAITTMVLTLFQLEKKSGTYALFTNSKSLTDIGITLACVVGLGMNWQGRIAGILSTSLIFSMIALVLFRIRHVTIVFPSRYGKHLLMVGVPLIVAHLTGWVNEMVDKIMITNILNPESTGLYSIGYRFGMVVMMVETAFSMAWMPFFYENIKENSYSNNLKIVKATYVYIAGLFLFALVFGLGGKYLLFAMVDRKFYAASQFILLISMAYCFDGIWKSFIGYLIYHDKTRVYSKIVLISAIINIVLNYVLLKRIGLIGSAWATFISLGVGAFLTVIVGIRCHPMPWLFKSNSPANP